MSSFDSVSFANMPSAPDAGAGWGAVLPWEAPRCDDDLDEECSFAPHIKSVKGVSSTMGDFMQGWSEQRERQILESRAEQHRLERQELPFRPELPAKATNETLLRSSGYKGPIQGWRKHAEHYKQVRESSSPACSGTRSPHPGREQASPSKPSRQRSWGAVVDRLYPFSGAAYEQVVRDAAAGGGADRGAGAALEDSVGTLECSGATEASMRSSASRQLTRPEAVSPKRRIGRPPKATWQYLYESGTRQLRGKSQPAPVESAPVPRPIARSEELSLRQERQPLWIPRGATPRSSVPNTARSVTPPPTSCSARPASAHAGGASSSSAAGKRAGRQLYERCERQKELQEKRRSLANELKRSEEMRECTFRPRTNKVPRGQGDENLSLYDRGVRGQLRKRLLEEEGAAEKAEAELRECTFRPAIRRGPAAVGIDDSAVSSCPRLCSSQEASRRDESSLQHALDEPQDLTNSVLVMLHDWKVQEAQHQAMSEPRMEPRRLPAFGTRMPPVPSERQDDEMSLDVQELLDEWRSSWNTPMLSAEPPPDSCVYSTSHVDHASGRHEANSSTSATLNETHLQRNAPPVKDGHEVQVFEMLASWRAGAAAALSSPAANVAELEAPAVVQSASVTSLRADPTPHPYPEE